MKANSGMHLIRNKIKLITINRIKLTASNDKPEDKGSLIKSKTNVT